MGKYEEMFDHIKRVYRWMLELYEALEDKQEIDIDEEGERNLDRKAMGCHRIF